MDNWEFITWLSNLDLNPQGAGLNWFSLLCFAVMFIFGLRRAQKKYGFRSAPLLVFAIPVFTLLCYYSLLDMTGGFIYALTRADVIAALVDEFNWHINPLGAPWNVTWSFPLIPLYVGVTWYLNKQFAWKKFFGVWVANLGLILASTIVFHTHNMRMLEGDVRTIFYMLSFMPMWILWTAGYYYSWRAGSEAGNSNSDSQ